MSESTSTNISVAQTHSTESIHASSTQHSRMADPGSTKRIQFYKSGDPRFNGIKMVVSNRSFKTFDALLDNLSKKVPLPFGVRNITTPRGMHHITSLEELEDGKSYICSHQRKIKPINLERARKKPLLWQSSRPISARRRAVQLAHQNEVAPFKRENTIVIGSSKNFVIFKNGDKDSNYTLVLNRKPKQSFDTFLDQVSETLQFPVFKLYSTDGRRILSMHALLLSSGTIVAAGREPFKPGNYNSEREYLPPKLPGISQRVFPKARSKPDLKSRKWKVSIFTSDSPSSGTTSQVYIMFYGHLRASAPVFLYSSQDDAFQRGHEDTFDVNIGDVGEVYKIRIGHTNSGASPGWHCEEVQLLNVFSNEQFCIKVKRWLSQDEDDGEICRELPVLRHGQAKLPVTKYKIQVITGDLWNAGTEANVYMSLNGQYGDTGSRHLIRSNKPIPFLKGQTDTFFMEAVHLGELHTVIIGHDGLEPGNGLYLEKVYVYDELKDKEYSFLCYRWLDEGEDDGKIVRRLSVSNEADLPARQEFELKKKEMWNAEKWKYQHENSLQFYSKSTKKFIRITPDGRVDALGDKKDKYGFFDVLVKRGNVRVFRSHHIRNLTLAIDKGIASALENNGVLCELLVHIQLNRCVTLESTRMPGMTISFNSDGEPADDNTTGYADICKEFAVHVKGIFHSGAIILLTTNWSQALCLRRDGSCSGTGKQNVESYWRVHKIGSAVCMFESVTWPRMYLQIKNGKCDGEGTGDEYCHFKVAKNYEHGSVTLESVRNKGIYFGLMPNGLVKPVIHTGEKNILLYPKVIKFGREKPTGTSATLSKSREEIFTQDETIIDSHDSVDWSPPVSTLPSKNGKKLNSSGNMVHSSNDWKVSVLTGNAGTSAGVSLWVYGSKGSTGPIILGTGKKGQLFKARQEDEFMVEIENIGKLYKIRLEHDGTGDYPEWNLERVTLQKMKNRKTYQFEAYSWLSRNHGNSELVCELPVVEDGEPVFPIVTYEVIVFTGHLDQAGTDAAVYICVHGTRGDSGKRRLVKSDLLLPFQQGEVDVFEIKAVSLGKLQRVSLGCEASRKSQYWYCEKVIIREQGNVSEYIFNCERWLPFMSQGILHSDIELMVQEMEMLSKVKPPTENDDGDWKITVVTGNLPNAGTDATVSLYVYGEGSNSGPIVLGSGSHQLFNVNSADTFQVNLKYLLKPFKIRVGHDNSGESPEWYLEEIRLQNLSSDLELHLPVNRWLGEKKDDGDTWRELFLPIDGTDPLPLLDYEIHIHTGEVSDAEIDANVYMNLFGTNGDSGKRKLHKSKFESAKFQRGNVDVFCIQAVSLGELQKIQITQDGIKEGKGWFLDKVFVRYTVDGDDHQVLFPCSRWFDVNREDGKTERTLISNAGFAQVKETWMAVQTGQKIFEMENPEEDTEDKMWTMRIKTATDSSWNNALKVTVIIYGSEEKTREIQLVQPDLERECFLPGFEDGFFVKFKDVGDIYKMRITCEHLPETPGWHLESIQMSKEQSRQEIQFDCNCWLSVDTEEEESIKEFRVVNNQQELLAVNQYIVAVHTGDHWGAETLANVYLTLYGERGDSGARKLHKSLIPGDKFTRNKTDCFILEAVSLGQLRKVVIGHDREGYGAGIYLKMVTVKESQDSPTEWVFPLWNWLDSHLGLCETVCKLHAIGKRLAARPKPVADSGGLWVIDIAGSGFQSSENLNRFSLWFYDNEKKELVEITVSENSLQIEEELQQIKDISKVHVSWSHPQVSTPWYLSSIHMKHTVTHQEMWLHFDCWMRPNEDKCVELPALFPDKDPLPVVEYTVNVHTGDAIDGGSTGVIYISMEGELGDSGKQFLNESGTEMLSFSARQVDNFKIKAVYLGKLQRIVLGFRNTKRESWFLEKIVVKGDFTASKYIFYHNDWITSPSLEEFTETEILLKESVAELNEIKSFSTLTQGRWQLQVFGTPAEEDSDLSVVVYGKAGKSQLHKVMNLHYHPFLLYVGDIGDVIKASFLSTALSSESRLQLHKVRMKDVDTKQEISFYPNNASFLEQNGSKDVAEVAAVLPNKPPLTEVTYSIYVKTGHFPASGTDADVFITIFGENGDSCRRHLRHSSLPKIFVKGKVNFFKIKALDLGMLSGVHVEHNAVGYGAGWYLDQITIQASDKADIKYLFPCQRWLDTAINDKQTDCKLKLLGKFNKTNQKLLAFTEGTLVVSIETDDIAQPGTNSTVSLTICCEKGNYEPLVFAKGTLTGSSTFHKMVDLSSNLGPISKIRLQMEDDDKDSSWFCRMVRLEHQQSGKILEFPFLQMFSSKLNKLVAELPVLNSSGPLLTMKSYGLYISFTQIPKPVTDTVLFITLGGTLGSTGKRKLICKKKDLSSKEKTVGFELEAVDIGVIQELLIEKEKQTNLQLEKAVVEEGSFIKNKYIFIAQSWKKEKTKMMSMTLPVTEKKEGHSSSILLNENVPMTTDGEWKIYLSAPHKDSQTETLDYNLQLAILFYGDKGRSNPIILQREESLENKDTLTYKVNLTYDLGELFKVRLGLENWQEDLGRLSLYHLKMQNTRTLDTFNQSINKTLPLSLSGDRWIEVPVEWPLKASLSAATYHITLYSTGLLEQKDQLNIGICVHGKHGDTGHRYLKWQSTLDENGDESFTAVLDAVELGEVHQTDISMSGRDDCKLHIKRIHVKESLRHEVYVFDVNEYFSIDASNPETRKELFISQVLHDENGETRHGTSFAFDGMENIEGKLVEHEIKVYTGDMRGADTDANVYFILFSENGNSFGPVQLVDPLQDKNPFERGKVDTFRISAKDIGKISHIEIGHDGKGLGNGWFLDKIEIFTLSTNETRLFTCNRWLAEDEDDGQTVIQLYS
ncbi:oxygen-regulated protein 1 isoform X2 [Aquarana catesbeiana]|uniref:oxygen-regulated protein 1 isoform X2 n=1 Tax=Aquarana catesbeiana TaxID=8400 RepID=UPI003CCA3681